MGNRSFGDSFARGMTASFPGSYQQGADQYQQMIQQKMAEKMAYDRMREEARRAEAEQRAKVRANRRQQAARLAADKSLLNAGQYMDITNLPDEVFDQTPFPAPRPDPRYFQRATSTENTWERAQIQQWQQGRQKVMDEIQRDDLAPDYRGTLQDYLQSTAMWRPGDVVLNPPPGKYLPKPPKGVSQAQYNSAVRDEINSLRQLKYDKWHKLSAEELAELNTQAEKNVKARFQSGQAFSISPIPAEEAPGQYDDLGFIPLPEELGEIPAVQPDPIEPFYQAAIRHHKTYAEAEAEINQKATDLITRGVDPKTLKARLRTYFASQPKGK